MKIDNSMDTERTPVSMLTRKVYDPEISSLSDGSEISTGFLGVETFPSGFPVDTISVGDPVDTESVVVVVGSVIRDFGNKNIIENTTLIMRHNCTKFIAIYIHQEYYYYALLASIRTWCGAHLTSI